jgi:hypothetical protein
MPTSPESLKDMSPSPVQTYATFPEPVKSAAASVEDSVAASVSPAKAAAAEVTCERSSENRCQPYSVYFSHIRSSFLI